MKKMNKLVALLLAAVMVLGMIPTTTAHAHEYHTHGIEEYPVIELDAVNTVTISEGGQTAYFTFTPEVTDMYHFYSSVDDGVYADTEADLYDAEMNHLTYNDQAEWGNELGIGGGNFLITRELTAGETYVLAAKLYGGSATGTFYVTLTTAHNSTGVVTKEPTCTEDGVMTYTCSYCGVSYDKPIPAAHIRDEETGVCTVCGDVYLISGTCGTDLTWTLDWYGTLTISGSGEMYDFAQYETETEPAAPWSSLTEAENPAFITVKSAVVEEGVASIGSNAFYNCYEMNSVTLPSTVTSIGDYAFANTGIQAIAMPDAVTELGVYAFQWCGNLTKVQMSDGLTAIPEGAFNGCGKIATIIWPAGLTTIGKEAFCNLSIENLVLPEGITTIDERAFRYSYMTSVILPSTLAVIGEEAFASCWDLQIVSFEGNAPASIASSTFSSVTATAYYPENSTSWNDSNMVNYGGTLTWQAKCANHVYGEWTSFEATCEVGAYRTRTCSVCAWVEIVVLSEPLGHDYVVNVIEPDCGSYTYGKTEITCTRCDYYESKDWVWPEHEYETTVTEATCTESGYTTYTCVKCGSSYNDHYIAATGHVIENWSEPSEATCTEASVKTGSCSVCGETATEEVSPALGHSWDEENPVEHEDGSKTFTCTVCGDTYRTEGTYLYLGDNVFSIAARTPSASKTYTAEDDGTLTITVSDMYFLNTWNNTWSTLAIDWTFREQMFTININGTAAEYTIEGSELAAKVIITTDVKSGDTVTVTLNHHEDKTYYYGYDLKVNMNLALAVAHTHTEETIPGYDATYDAPGMTEGKRCSECGEILLAQEEIPMLDYNEGIVPLNTLIVSCGDFEPDGGAAEGPAELAIDNDLNTIWHTDWQGTSRENHWIQFELTGGYEVNELRYKPRITGNTNGIITQYDILVSNDGETFTSVASGNWEGDRNWKVVEFDAQNVKFVRLQAVDAITDNSWVFACAAEIRLVGEKAAEHVHSFGEWTVVTEATCTTAGSEERTCECGETETRKIEALGHDIVSEFIEPTCYKSGYTLYTCTRCDWSYKDDPVEPEHKWDEGTVTAPTCTEMGCTTYKCTVCGYEYEDEAGYTDALGHDFVNGECSRCDAVKDATFTDVPVGSFFFDPVEWAVEQGITTGATATTFNPTGDLQRAAVVTMLWRAAGKPEPTTTNNPFTDVKETDFYYKAVLWAVEKGITNGTSATTFSPFGVTNRAQAVTFLWRYLGQPASSTTSSFSDVVAGMWYEAPINWAVENGVTNGMGDGTFGINGNCNRAQMVTFMYRALA